MSRQEAIDQAQREDKDVILIAEQAQPPVAKIINFSKFKYQLDQQKAEGKKKAKKQEIKELRFRPFMGQGDFDSRMKKIREFLEDGDKVRPYVEFKGREITRKEFGFNMVQKIIDQTNEYASVEIPARLLGKKIIVQLMPVKKKKESNVIPDVTTKPDQRSSWVVKNQGSTRNIVNIISTRSLTFEYSLFFY